MAMRALATSARRRAAAAAFGQVGQATAWPRAAGPALRSATRSFTSGEGRFTTDRGDIHSKYAAVYGGKVADSAPGAAATAAPSAATGTSGAALQRLEAFYIDVVSANWADYLMLVYTGPFWEAEFAKLISIAQPHLGNKEVSAKMLEVQELMDVLYRCEDVRDHINELCELATRASGFMGTGWQAEEKVENIDEQAMHCSKAYEALLKEHPNLKPKIEQTVGHGLAILRQKHKFKFHMVHRYGF